MSGSSASRAPLLPRAQGEVAAAAGWSSRQDRAPHRHSLGLETPELQLPWGFSGCAHPRTGMHTHVGMHAPACSCAHTYLHHNHLCTHVHIHACTSRHMCKHVQTHTHTCAHMHTQACAHSPSETSTHVNAHTRAHTHTEEGGHSWHSPGSTAELGSSPYAPDPLVCIPGG